MQEDNPTSLLVEMLKTSIRKLLQDKDIVGRVESRPNKKGEMVIGIILTDHKLGG